MPGRGDGLSWIPRSQTTETVSRKEFTPNWPRSRPAGLSMRCCARGELGFVRVAKLTSIQVWSVCAKSPASRTRRARYDKTRFCYCYPAHAGANEKRIGRGHGVSRVRIFASHNVLLALRYGQNARVAQRPIPHNRTTREVCVMVSCDVCKIELDDRAAIKTIVWPVKGTTVLELHVHLACGNALLRWVREVGISNAADQIKKTKSNNN